MAMKNATAYQKKIRAILDSAKPRRPGPVADDIETLLLSVLEAEAPRRQAAQACQAIRERFVDYNELRVASPKDLQECMGKAFPAAREKADSLLRALNGLFDRTCRMSLEHLAGMAKRELREHLLGLGLSPYAAARLVLEVFGGHAVPVDQALVDTLEMDGYIAPGTALGDAQGFLERIVSQKDAPGVHDALRAYVEKRSAALAAKRRKEARAAAREQARREALARKQAEQQARAQAEQQAAAARKAASARRRGAARTRPAAGRKGRPTRPARRARPR